MLVVGGRQVQSASVPFHGSALVVWDHGCSTPESCQYPREAGADDLPEPRALRVRHAAQVYEAFKEGVTELDREMFVVLLLDGKNGVLGVNLVLIGSLNAWPASRGSRTLS